VLQKIKHQTLNSNPTGQTLLSLAALTIIKKSSAPLFHAFVLAYDQRGCATCFPVLRFEQRDGSIILPAECPG
jgi:hypothetical protein